MPANIRHHAKAVDFPEIQKRLPSCRSNLVETREPKTGGLLEPKGLLVQAMVEHQHDMRKALHIWLLVEMPVAVF
jgi:hypothetical protein